MLNATDAATLATNFDSIAADPEKKAQALAQLQEWRDNEVSNINQARQDQAAKMFTDLDTLGGYWTKDLNGKAAPFTNDLPTLKARTANASFIAAQSGREKDEILPAYDVLKKQLATQFGNPNASDTELFGMIQGKVKHIAEQREQYAQLTSGAAANGMEDAMSGSEPDWGASLSGFNEKFPFDDPNAAAAAHREAYQKAYDMASTHAPVFDAAKEMLMTETGRSTAKSSTWNNVADEMANLSRDERQNVYDMLSLWAKANPRPMPEGVPRAPGAEQEFVRQLAVSAERGVIGGARGTGNMLSDLLLSETAKDIGNGTARVVSDGRASLKDMVSFTTQDSDAERKPTAEESASILGEIKRAQTLNQVARELRSQANNTIDPVRNVLPWLNKHIENAAYGIAGSAPLMAEAMIPFAGIPLVAASMAGEQYDRIRVEHPEISQDNAMLIAGVAGTVMGSIQKLQAGELLQKTPVLGGVLKALVDPASSFWARLGVKTLTLDVEQNLMNVTPAATQAIFAALNHDVPKVDWQRELGATATGGGQFETLLTMLPFALVGAGVGRMSKPMQDTLRSPHAMAALGIDPAKARDIADVAAASMGDAQTLFQRAWHERAPEQIADAAKAMDDNARRTKAVQNSPETPTLRKNGDAWEIVEPDGKVSSSFDNEDMAYQAWHDKTSALIGGERHDGAVRELANYFNEQDPNRKVEILEKSKTLQQAIDEKSSTPEQVAERMRIAGINEDPAQVHVMGENVGEIRDNIYSDVSRIYSGADVADVVEERGHSEFKKALHEGRVTMDDARYAARVWAMANDPKADPNHAPSDTEVHEAVADMVKAKFFGSLDVLQKLPASIKAFIARVSAYFKDVLTRAAKLKALEADGTLEPNWQKFLAESVGLRSDHEAATHAEKAAGEIAGVSMKISAKLPSKAAQAAEDAHRAEMQAQLKQAGVGHELLQSVYDLGGLPAKSSKHSAEASGELDRVRDAFKARGKGANENTEKMPLIGLFSKNAKSLDILREALAERGFRFDTPHEMIDAIEARITTGKKHFAEGAVEEPNYSIKKKRDPNDIGRDLLSGQSEDLKLVGEKGTDFEKLARESEAAQKASEEAKKKQDEQQGTLFSIRSADYVERLGKQMDALKRDPDERVKIYERAQQVLQRVVDRYSARDDTDTRANAIQNIAELDAVLSAMPPEVRAKVGGYMKVASMKTERGLGAEIGRRIEMMDRELERVLSNEYSDRFDALLEKAQPKGGAGEKATGKIGVEGHRWFDMVREAVALPQTDIATRMDAIEGQLSGDITDTDRAKLLDQWAVLNNYGNFHDKTASEMATGYKQAEQVYTKGREKWLAILEARSADREGKRATAIDEAGGEATARKVQDAKAAENKSGQGGSLANFLGNAQLSFAQRLGRIFGPKSETTLHYESAVSDAYREKASRIIEARQAMKEMLLEAFGAKTWGVVSDRLLAMQQPREKSGVLKREGFKRPEQQIPVDVAKRILEGDMQPEAHGLGSQELAILQSLYDENEAKAGNRKKEILRLAVTTDPGTLTEQNISELQAVHLTMLERQAQYRKAMDFHGWDADARKQLEAMVSPEGRKIRDWLSAQYEKGYGGLNETFKTMFGIDLPKVKDYAPGYFETSATPTELDPFATGMDAAGLAAGFLKQRKNHLAEPAIKDAMQVFWQHTMQTEHWRAFAPLVSEMRSVFGNVDVRHAIEAAGGTAAARDVSSWIEHIEKNGVRDAQTNAWLPRVITAMTRTGLAFNVGTWMKHLPNAFASLADVPAMDWMRGLGKVLSGKADASLKEIWKSEAIRSRIALSFSPDLKQILAGEKAKPSKVGDFLDWGVARIPWIAANFTTFSAAIAHDYHFTQAIESGMSETQSRDFAMKQTQLTIQRTAQPDSLDRKSLAEIDRTGVGKLMMLFHTPERQQWGLAFAAMANVREGKITKAEAARVLFSTWVLAPVLMQTMTGLARYMFTDEDAEKAWNWKRYAAAIALGPSSGIYGLGQLAEVAAQHFTGSPVSMAGNPWSEAAQRLFGGGKHIAEYLEGSGEANLKDIGNVGAGLAQILSGFTDVPVETVSVLNRLLGQGAHAAKNATEGKENK